MEMAELKQYAQFIPTLAEWHHKQWAYINPGGSVEQRISSYQAHLESEGIPKMFVAVSGDKLLGSASLIPHDMDTRMDLSPWLASVFVDPAQRNQGAGSALVRHVVKEAGAMGYETIYLFTPDRAALYARLGWSTLEQTEYRGHKVEVMSIKTA